MISAQRFINEINSQQDGKLFSVIYQVSRVLDRLVVASLGLALAYTLKDYGSNFVARWVSVLENTYQPGDGSRLTVRMVKLNPSGPGPQESSPQMTPRSSSLILISGRRTSSMPQAATAACCESRISTCMQTMPHLESALHKSHTPPQSLKIDHCY